MTLNNFEIFIKVTERMSMTAAAADLYLSQPAVSQAIKEMESHYGVRLFNRVGKRLTLTPSGAMLREYADSLMHCVDNIEKKQWVRSSKPAIKMGISNGAYEFFFPGLYERYLETSDEVNIAVTVNQSSEIDLSLMTLDLDFAILAGESLRTDTMKSVRIGTLDWHFICAANSRYLDVADGATVPFDRRVLNALPYIVPCKGQYAREVFDHAMLMHLVDCVVRGSFNCGGAVVDAVLRDYGVGLVSELTVLPPGVRRFRIEKIDMRMPISLVCLKDKLFSPEKRRLIDFIAEASKSGKP